MARIALAAEKRNPGPKSALLKTRQSGFVPGVVVHKGDPSVAIQLSNRALSNVLHTEAGRNVLIDLKIKNERPEKQRMVVVKDIQRDPVHGGILHVDFHQISLTDKIVVNVPILQKGEAVGVRNEGGVLETPLRELHIECLPTDIPEHIEVDISGLALNQSVHVRDLAVSPNIKVLSDPDMVVVQVKLPAAEEAAPAAEEIQEPEVISERKPEGEEAAVEDEKAVPAKEAKPEKADKVEKK